MNLQTRDQGGFKALLLFPAFVPQDGLKLDRRSAFAEFGCGLYGNALVQGSGCTIQGGDLLLGLRGDRQRPGVASRRESSERVVIVGRRSTSGNCMGVGRLPQQREQRLRFTRLDAVHG
jgi:hypothetical protein